jgi:hypothetical protein
MAECPLAAAHTLRDRGDTLARFRSCAKLILLLRRPCRACYKRSLDHFPFAFSAALQACRLLRLPRERYWIDFAGRRNILRESSFHRSISKEAPMRVITPPVAAALAFLASAAFAQTGTVGDTTGAVTPAPTTGAVSPPLTGGVPSVGGPLSPATDTGLDKVAPDGVSTKIVRAVPCSTAARGTDGTTTCVGIPSGSVRSNRR